MSVDCQASRLPKDTLFWEMYSTLQNVAQKAQAAEHAAQHEVIPKKPTMDDCDQITLFLCGQTRYEWSQDELDQMNKLWRQITGFEMSAHLSSDCDIPELIQVLQVREAGLARMYSNSSSNETTISRQEMMKLHTKFFDDYGCRITDFHNTESFLFIVETHIQSQFA